MRRPQFYSLILFLLSGICFLATLPVITEKDTVTLAGDLPAEIGLTYPRWVFLGQSATVQAQIVLGDEVTAKTPTHLLARFESNIEDVFPSGELQAAIQSGKPISLKWKLKPFQAGSYKSIIWLSTRGAGGEQLLLAREIEVDAREFLLTSVGNIRIVSGLLTGIGFSLFLLGSRRRKILNYS